MSDRDERDRHPGPCARIVAAVFGSAFLIALLSVPVTTTTARLRQDPGSAIIFKTTYPRNSSMFLPRYLSFRARPGENGTIRLRAAQWTGTMAVVAVLGVFDYFVFCRLLRRKPRPPGPA